ncbi:glutamate racemase [Lactococcus muris]|uniref:Multifunctional fusion protein n=1 Tax=Lactococcus muris TaxID=2941330 RepID=A0ABV4D9P0_9LACT
MDNRPIGLLDSGVGGLTVVREILRQLPNEEIVYIGDTQRAPYGSRSNEQITAFTWDMVNFLLSKNVKMIVFACNTATAVALDEVRAALDIPVVGVILSGASSAIQKTVNKKVGVIATQATVNSGQYRKVIQFKSSSVEVLSLACPDFVPLVESNQVDTETAKNIVAETLRPMVGKVDTLILGCTHYPLLRKLIQKEMGQDVQLIDSGSETVRDITVLLNYFALNGEERDSIRHRFYTTGDAGAFQVIANRWLGVGKIRAEHTELSSERILLIATRNDGKTREFKRLFEEFGYKIKNLKDYPELPDIKETGMTFEENARLKAEQIAAITGQVVIGDDSGLCVDVLGGLPGVWSHRFAGPNPTDEENIAKLLHELASTAITPERRTAHFHTTLVAAYPGQESLVVEADWQGRIGLTPQGENGFGYDPIFLVGTSDKTAAQLTAEEKNTASHRGQALQKLMAELPEWLEHIKK